jgi:hypothetical protein
MDLLMKVNWSEMTFRLHSVPMSVLYPLPVAVCTLLET